MLFLLCVCVCVRVCAYVRVITFLGCPSAESAVNPRDLGRSSTESTVNPRGLGPSVHGVHCESTGLGPSIHGVHRGSTGLGPSIHGVHRESTRLGPSIHQKKIAGRLPAGRHQPSCTQHTLLALGTRSHVLAYRTDTQIPALSSQLSAILLYEPPGRLVRGNFHETTNIH